jgi:hypothetical protein
MHRRAVLKGLVAAGVPAAAAAAALTARTAASVRDTTDASLESLKAQVDALKTRFEESDARSRKLMKAAIALAALSLGIDVTTLL